MIKFEDWGTGYYIITRDHAVLGRMTKMACGNWYFADGPKATCFSFAAPRFNDAKRVIRAHFAA